MANETTYRIKVGTMYALAPISNETNVSLTPNNGPRTALSPESYDKLVKRLTKGDIPFKTIKLQYTVTEIEVVPNEVTE
jgi:hypothetical protein